MNIIIRLTVGGYRLDYTRDLANSTADIATFKILFHSTISTEDAEMMMMDIKNIILENLYPDMSTCDLLCQSSQMRSLPNATYRQYQMQAGSTLKF
jgi:hypothetical protein